MKKYRKTRLAYDELISVIKKNVGNILVTEKQIEFIASRHLFEIELQEKYGLKVSGDKFMISSDRSAFIGKYLKIGVYGNNNINRIFHSDSNIYPENEMLLNIDLGSGAYIFGKHYPEELFNDFFEELKSYGAKYVDSKNHCLYFPIEKASKVFNNFNSILNRFRERDNQKTRKYFL